MTTPTDNEHELESALEAMTGELCDDCDTAKISNEVFERVLLEEITEAVTRARKRLLPNQLPEQKL